MVRLDVLVAKVLADARRAMDERKAGAGDEPAPVVSARERVMGGKRALGELDHPRISSRRMAKKATGLDAKISIKR